MKLKRFLLIALCVVIGCVSGLSMIACTPPSGGDPLAGLTDDLKFNEYGDPDFFDDNGNAIQLKVWSIVGNPDDEYLELVNRSFNDYYKTSGVSAKVTPIANADFYTQLTNTINTDPENAPDMVIFHSERLPLLASNNLLLPLESFYDALGESGTFKKENYFEKVIDECYYNGKLYGVPLDVHSGMWYVRSDILEKNGLSMPSTLSEFVSVCNSLIDKFKAGNLWYRTAEGATAAQHAWKKADPEQDSFTPAFMTRDGGIECGWLPQTAVFQNGGKLTGSDGKPAWNTDALKEVMQMFRDWQDGTGSFKGTAYSGSLILKGSEESQGWGKLWNGQTVFKFEGPWWAEQRITQYDSILADLKDDNGKSYKPLDLLSPSKLLALDETSESAGLVYGVGHCFSVCRTVTSKSKCVAAALYAQYMTENSAEYTQGGHLPANKAVYESEKFRSMPCYESYVKKLGNPNNFVMLGGTEHYKPVYEGVKGVYNDALDHNKRADDKGNEITVLDLISARYNEAMREISAIEDL